MAVKRNAANVTAKEQLMKKNKAFWWDYSLMTIGSALVGVSLALFLVPTKLSNGGVSGIAMIFHHIANLPTGITIIVLNIPLFLLGIKHLGKLFGFRTVIGIAASSLFTDFFAELLKLSPITTEPLLASLFGGLIMGAGLGMIFRAGGSTGGSDIIAQIASKYFNFSPGQAIVIVDVIIIAASGFVFKSVELALWSIISFAIVSYTLDIVLQGIPYMRIIYIISNKADDIGKRVNLEMGRGATIIPSWGVYTGEPRKVIFIVLTRKELPGLYRIIREVDRNAFIFGSEVFTVMGEGFRGTNSKIK